MSGTHKKSLMQSIQRMAIWLHEHSRFFRALIDLMLPAYLKLIRRRQNKKFLKNGAHLLGCFKKCLDDAGLKFWLTSGTLLGAYRENRLLGHDLDLDVAMFAEDKKAAQEALVKGGFTLLHEFNVAGEEALEQAYFYRGVRIDIFYMKKEENSLITYVFYRRQITTGNDNFMVIKQIYPDTGFIPYRFLGDEYLIPEKTVEYLTANYGENFMTPDPTWDYTRDIPSAVYYTLEEKHGEYVDRTVI